MIWVEVTHGAVQSGRPPRRFPEARDRAPPARRLTQVATSPLGAYLPALLQSNDSTDRTTALPQLQQPTDPARLTHTMERNTSMNMKLELVPVPVTDVDQAKAFYTDQVGFVVDVDVQPSEGMRFVQLTPPGSACSIVIGIGLTGISDMAPGTQQGLHLVVSDIDQARTELMGRGVVVGDVVDVGGGVKYAWFADPDGNTMGLQEMPWRTGENF